MRCDAQPIRGSWHGCLPWRSALRSHTASQHHQGFTLFEMLTAMVIMSVLAMSIYSSLQIAFRARRSAERALEPARVLALSLEMVAAELRAAAPITGMLAIEFIGTDARESAIHETDSIFFYSTSGYQPWPEHDVGFRQVEFLVAHDMATQERVLLRRTVTAALTPITPEPDELVICRGVRAFNVRYHDGSSWIDSWDSASFDDALPYAVELTLELEPDEEPGPNERGPMMTTIVSIPLGGARSSSDEEGGSGGGGGILNLF